MLSKTIFLFTVLSIISAQHKVSTAQKKNIKRMASNDKRMSKTHSTLGTHIKAIKNHFNSMKKLQNHIKKNGVHMSHRHYNKLLKRYGWMVYNYNLNRKNVCAKLPPLWALVNKKRNDYTPLEVKCKKWFYQGQILGGNIANAFYKISFYRYYGSWLTNRLKCIYRMLTYTKAKNSTMAHLRKCYHRGYHYQMRRTFIGVHRKNKSLTIIRRPFRSYRAKKRELKKAIDRLKK